jgi:sorting nexin-1/2
MDGFDDLLAPSRHALEDNPFADPFAKQRSSPDPWATPFATTDSHGFDSQHFNSLDSLNNDKFGPSDNDPMNLPGPAHAADDDDEPLGRMRSPGFRESIGASFSETATIRPATTEDYPSFPSTTSPSQSDHDNLSPSTHSGSVTSDTQKTSLSSLGSSTFSSPPPSATEPSFLSPLENPSTGVERSIIGLSLGGETLGWQTETQTPWQSEHPISIPTKLAQSDEDSDDDRPIMRMLKHHDQDDSVPVSVHILCPIHCSFVFEKTSQKAIRNDNGIQPVFMITVDDPQKVGDPIRSFTMYTVHTRVTLFSL